MSLPAGGSMIWASVARRARFIMAMYDVVGRRLVANDAEAATVRALFELFAATR